MDCWYRYTNFLIFQVCSILFNQPIAVVISLITGILITGAFHEDGFADVVDGFGGGWNKKQILDIMKDSRIGAFGAISITLILLLKYTVLNSLFLNTEKWWINLLILISYHSLARLTSTTLFLYPNMQEKMQIVKQSLLQKQLE